MRLEDFIFLLKLLLLKQFDVLDFTFLSSLLNLSGDFSFLLDILIIKIFELFLQFPVNRIDLFLILLLLLWIKLLLDKDLKALLLVFGSLTTLLLLLNLFF